MDIRLGIIGCGSIVKGHLRRLLQLPEVKIVGLADPSPEAMDGLRALFAELEGVPQTADYKTLLQRYSPNAVLIASPHTVHFEQIIDSFAAGCHVLTEKPMVCSVDHAEQVLKKRDAAARVLLVSYQRHYQPVYEYITQTITSGKIGDVQFVAAIQTQSWLRSTRGKWRSDPKLSGGGQILDSGSHLLDFIMHGTGLTIKSVFAHELRLGAAVDADTAIACEFENGAIGTISIVGNAPKPFWEDIGFYGSKGSLQMRSTAGVGLSKPFLIHNDFEDGRVRIGKLGEGSDPDVNFVDAVLGRDSVRSTGEAALQVIKVTEAVWKSVGSGRREPVV